MLDENGNVVEPEWSVLMFWEDFTYILQNIWNLIKSLFA